MSERPVLIGVAGPSGSGKSELATALARKLRAVVLPLDSYYRDLSHVPFEERARTNFDSPEALDIDLLASQLAALAAGDEVLAPVYDFATHTRKAESRRLRAGLHVIVEGLFALYWPEVRKLLDLGVFVATADEICLERRILRDLKERGRSRESVVEQYRTTVRPMAEAYVLPSRAHAHVVVSGAVPVEQSVDAVLWALTSRRRSD